MKFHATLLHEDIKPAIHDATLLHAIVASCMIHYCMQHCCIVYVDFFMQLCCMKVEHCSTFVQQVAWNFQNTNIYNCSKSRPQL